MNKSNRKNLYDKLTNLIRPLVTVAGIALAVVASFNVNIQPFNAFGGAVWFSNGPHYISGDEIESRIVKINAPYEQNLAQTIEKDTPICDSVDSGYCQQGTRSYVYKTLTSAAVPYKPAIPDRKEITGYCTLCRDGTFSPSCAVGRGACSWHGGVASYNVARYRTIYGTPAIEARPAVYSYTPKSYKDSPDYTEPSVPSLKTIVESGDEMQ